MLVTSKSNQLHFYETLVQAYFFKKYLGTKMIVELPKGPELQDPCLIQAADSSLKKFVVSITAREVKFFRHGRSRC